MKRKMRKEKNYYHKEIEMKTKTFAVWVFAAVLVVIPLGNTAVYAQGEPSTADEFVDRGIDYRLSGDFDRAIADFETVLRLDPSDDYAREAVEQTRKQRGR
jgi:tetratricopeptide (TPR) repeat protein